jgi:uncharacterized protein
MHPNFAEANRLARSGQWDEVAALLDRAPELAASEDNNGRTLLMTCASLGGSAATIRRLIELGADPNRRATDGSNALASAIVGGSRHGLSTVPELTTLLELGADPGLIADGGMPALHWAIAQHRPEHVIVLLEHGADVDAMTDDDPPESADDVARRVGSAEMMRLLSEHRRQKQ